MIVAYLLFFFICIYAYNTKVWREKKVLRTGFEPAPFRNRAWIYRLRPLGHLNIPYKSVG